MLSPLKLIKVGWNFWKFDFDHQSLNFFIECNLGLGDSDIILWGTFYFVLLGDLGDHSMYITFFQEYDSKCSSFYRMILSIKLGIDVPCDSPHKNYVLEFGNYFVQGNYRFFRRACDFSENTIFKHYSFWSYSSFSIKLFDVPFDNPTRSYFLEYIYLKYIFWKFKPNVANIVASGKRLTTEWRGLKFGAQITLTSYGVQGHVGVTRCICLNLKMAYNLKTFVRKAKWSEICDPGIPVAYICGYL